MINLKVIKGRYYQVNLCDTKLIGKRIGEVSINNLFYGEPVNEETAIKELSKANLVNALGVKAIELVEKVFGVMKVNVIDNTPNVIFMIIE